MKRQLETLSSKNLKANGQARIVVTMPAYNAAKTLLLTFNDIPKDLVTEIIMVDDCSCDETVSIGGTLPVKLIKHPHRAGYGGNQKTCYLESLRDSADIVVMLHPDYQYDPHKISEMVAPILSGRSDIVLGSRILNGGALKGGMPLYKYVANRALTACQNLILRTNLSEFHTGYRAYSRRFLETVPFLRNSSGFVFDAEILCQAVFFDFEICEIPVETRYFPEASSIGFWSSIVYGLGVLWTLCLFLSAKLFSLKAPLFQK